MEAALRLACLKMDLAEIKRLIEQGATITGKLLLSLTEISGCEEIVKYLVEVASEQGTLGSIIHENHHGRTLLYCVINKCTYNGNYRASKMELIKLLLEKGANADDTEYVHNQSCLRNAVLEGDVELVKLLLEHGATLGEDDGGYSELDLAGINGSTEIVKLLLPYINISYTEYDTKLIYAVWTANLQMVKNLLLYGIKLRGEPSDLTSKERGEMFMNGHDFTKGPWSSLLKHAVEHNQYEIVKYLLEEGEDPNKMCELGDRPLEVAVSKKNKEIAKLLMQYGAKIVSNEEKEFMKD